MRLIDSGRHFDRLGLSCPSTIASNPSCCTRVQKNKWSNAWSYFHSSPIFQMVVKTVSKYFCRLELKGNKYVLGEFLDFDGILVEDIQAWKKIKRSKVSQLIVQKTSEGTFGFVNFPSIYCNFCLFCGQLCQNIILKNLIFLRNQKLKDRENGEERSQSNARNYIFFPITVAQC